GNRMEPLFMGVAHGDGKVLRWLRDSSRVDLRGDLRSRGKGSTADDNPLHVVEVVVMDRHRWTRRRVPIDVEKVAAKTARRVYRPTELEIQVVDDGVAGARRAWHVGVSHRGVQVLGTVRDEQVLR